MADKVCEDTPTRLAVNELSHHMVEMRVELADMNRRISHLESLPKKFDELQKAFLEHPHVCYKLLEERFVSKVEFDPVKDNYVSKDDFTPIKNMAYGVVATILLGVCGSLLTLVMTK